MFNQESIYYKCIASICIRNSHKGRFKLELLRSNGGIPASAAMMHHLIFQWFFESPKKKYSFYYLRGILDNAVFLCF